MKSCGLAARCLATYALMEKNMLNLYYLLEAAASDVTSSSAGSSWATWGMWIIIIAMVVLMFVFSGRQRKKQEKEMNDRMSALKVGDKIETVGRIYGKIVEINDEENTLVLLTGSDELPGYIKVDKMAVYRTINDFVPTAEDTTENTETSTDEVVDSTDESADAMPFGDDSITADDAIEIMSEDDEKDE